MFNSLWDNISPHTSPASSFQHWHRPERVPRARSAHADRIHRSHAHDDRSKFKISRSRGVTRTRCSRARSGSMAHTGHVVSPPCEPRLSRSPALAGGDAHARETGTWPCGPTVTLASAELRCHRRPTSTTQHSLRLCSRPGMWRASRPPAIPGTRSACAAVPLAHTGNAPAGACGGHHSCPPFQTRPSPVGLCAPMG